MKIQYSLTPGLEYFPRYRMVFQLDHEELITYKQSMLYAASVPAKIQS